MSIAPPRRYPRAARESGVALLTALLVTAIVAVIAVNMVARQQIDIRRAGNIFDADQAYLYALGIESWAQGMLAKDMQKDPAAPKVDGLNDDWATVLAPIKVEGGKVAGSIEDLQGRFNLNNLVGADDQPSPNDVRIFQKLLSDAKLDPDLVYPVIDWIDKNVNFSSSNPAEDVEYTKLKPAYRAANARLVSPSELVLIKGYNAEVYRRLAPLVTALPETGSAINVNTAPPQVLMALLNIGTGEAGALVRQRKAKPFASAADLLAALPNGYQLPEGVSPALDSRYFLVTASSQAGRSQVQLYSLLFRDPTGKTTVMARAQGTY